MTNNKRAKNTFGVIGCGGRGLWTFILGAKRQGFADRLVALCDTNAHRLGVAIRRFGRPVEAYTDPDAFFRDGKMDTVVIATPDYLHCDLALKAFAAGRHVVTEKPMAIDVEQCDRMIIAARQANRDLQVTFNLRFSPTLQALKALVARGAIGSVVSLQSDDIRNVGHGSDYFRRWHRRHACSGGILTHKACHTFDILNWLAESRVARVYATGGRRYFLPKEGAGPRCKTCRIKRNCSLYVDLNKAIPTGVPWQGCDRELYAEAEHLDGYFRDQCVFGADAELHDHIQILAHYENGIPLTYNLLMFSPFAERSFVVRGTNGTLIKDWHGFVLHLLFRGAVTDQRQQMFEPLPPAHIKSAEILSERGQGKGDHGGADGWMLESLFTDAEDPSRAGALEGRNAVMSADAAYRSMARGAPVDVAKEFGPAP